MLLTNGGHYKLFDERALQIYLLVCGESAGALPDTSRKTLKIHMSSQGAGATPAAEFILGWVRRRRRRCGKVQSAGNLEAAPAAAATSTTQLLYSN